jgi:hypothetical protein
VNAKLELQARASNVYKRELELRDIHFPIHKRWQTRGASDAHNNAQTLPHNQVLDI